MRLPCPLSRRYAGLLQFCSSVLLPFVAIRCVLLLIGVVTVYYIEPLVSRQQPITIHTNEAHFPAILWWMWSRFDSGFYIGLAQQGYWGAETLHRQSNWAFFPLYPLLMRLLALPLSAFSHHSYLFAGLIISNVAAIIAVFYLYQLTTYELNQRIASRAVWYLLLFPMSFFLSTVYPESLFLALSLASIYYARMSSWWIAGVLGGLAALTRPQGVLILVVVGWEYWQVLADQFAPLQGQRQDFIAVIQDRVRSRSLGLWASLRAPHTWRGFAALLLIPLGLGSFCLYAEWKVGAFFPFTEVEKYGWGRSFIDPLTALQLLFTHPQPPSPYDWSFYGLNVVVIIGFLLVVLPIFRILPSLYGIFTLAFILMPLATTSTQSTARFYMAVFPVYMLLAWWSSKGSQEWQLTKHTLIICSFALLLAVATVLWTLGVYSMS